VAATQRRAVESGAALRPGPYEGSAYLQAAPHYWALYTCNTWVAYLLKQAGISVDPRGVIFAGQLWRRLQKSGLAAH
jgi:hypothetical protein